MCGRAVRCATGAHRAVDGYGRCVGHVGRIFAPHGSDAAGRSLALLVAWVGGGKFTAQSFTSQETRTGPTLQPDQVKSSQVKYSPDTGEDEKVHGEAHRSAEGNTEAQIIILTQPFAAFAALWALTMVHGSRSLAGRPPEHPAWPRQTDRSQAILTS